VVRPFFMRGLPLCHNVNVPGDSLSSRLAQVHERIANACARSGRSPESVRLLAVTKVFGPDVIREAYAVGLRDFGENYVQEMERKAPAIADLTGAHFHLIGHLQNNKSKKAAELFSAIDTIDSDRLASRLNAEGKLIDVMIEVKLSSETSKSGAAPGYLPELLHAIGNCPNLRLTGLMTVPPWSADPEQARPYFARLRALAEDFGLSDLSMGMSNDLEAAVEEGATWVRVGTALFGRRRKP
jgi:pyridoxal phosphate enzyme (YggS family)